jgi:hypothetical protein
MSSRRSALRSLALAMVGVLVLVLPGRALAQSELRPGRIVGQVVDSAGAPVAGAHVVLRQDDREIARTVTGPEGKFAFDRIRPGRYVVAAEKAGVGRGRGPVLVKSGEVSRIKITLTRG